MRVRFARAVWLQARPQQARGLLCAAAGQTPKEALLFAPGLTGLALIAQDQFAREEADLSLQTARMRSDQGRIDQGRIVQGRIVQGRIVPGAGVLPQAQLGWWHRLLAVCPPSLCSACTRRCAECRTCQACALRRACRGRNRCSEWRGWGGRNGFGSRSGRRCPGRWRHAKPWTLLCGSSRAASR